MSDSYPPTACSVGGSKVSTFGSDFTPHVHPLPAEWGVSSFVALLALESMEMTIKAN